MLFLTATLCFATPSEPVSTTWLAVFAAQTDPYRPQKTHTFATVLRAKPGQLAETLTISWLPSTQRVRGFAIRPECGTNWNLTETLDWTARGGMCVSVWGPYPVEDCLFDSFACQVANLQSGQVRYKSLDVLRPNRNAINCVHAVQGVMIRSKKPVGVFGYGETASRESVDHFAPCILNWCANESVLRAMGVDPHCVTMRGPEHRPTRLQALDSFTR